jgi:formylglycine-generating enzyme required for sulfatase activity
MTNVHWRDAKRYIQWLSQQTGLVFMLPSESQWEYAARAGQTSDYYWGATIGNNNAVCDGCGSLWDSTSVAPIGSFSANGFGLYDMHGNVWEWVEDCWHDNYEGAPNDGTTWKEASKCRKRVLRGGSWTNEKENLRTSTRFRGYSIKKDQDIGFRIIQVQ